MSGPAVVPRASSRCVAGAILVVVFLILVVIVAVCALSDFALIFAGVIAAPAPDRTASG